MIFGRFTDLHPIRIPDCTCCRCNEEFFDNQMCDGCGYCKACCTCALISTAPEAEPDESDECPFWDDDKRAVYWYAARARYIRFEIILEGEE